MGRIRLHVALNCSSYSLGAFVLDNVEPGSTIATDAWKGYNFIENNSYEHEITNQSRSKSSNSLYGVHLVITLIRRLIRGTYQGRFDQKYLQNYLDEFVFRFNRRKSAYIGKKFMRIVQQVVVSYKRTWKHIKWDMDPVSRIFWVT